MRSAAVASEYTALAAAAAHDMLHHNKKFVSANVMVRESLRTRNVEQNLRLRDGERFNDGDFRQTR